MPIITSKREQYRQQIRKDHLTARFKQIRNSMVEQDELHSLKETLSQLADNFSDCELKEALLILQCHEENAGFLQEVGRLQLERLLLDLLQKHGADMSITQATELMAALNKLTYYCKATSHLLTENIEFIDHLRERIGQLDLQSLESLRHLRTILIFLMNTTSEFVNEYNNYLAESDLSKVINIQLAKTVEIGRHQTDEYRQVAFEAREYCLRVYCNIVNAIDNQGHVPAKLVGDVLRDEEYLLRHQEKTFVLLSNAMNNEHFWPCLMKDPDSELFCAPISEAIDDIQRRCFKDEFLLDKHNQLKPEEAGKFHAVIQFLNQLFIESDDFEVSWSRLVENVLNGYMLGQFLIEAHQKKESKRVIHALKLFLNLSRSYEITGEQLIIVRPADDPLELLKVFTDINLLKGEKTGPACLEILATLLRKERSFLPAVMEFRVLEQLAELFETKEECHEIMARAIELCTQLVVSERELKEEKRMVALMEAKGITRAIEKLNDSQEKRVYTLAEIFTETANECK